MNIKNKDILNCFPLLASVLGDSYGVKVRIGGDKAMTDGKTIYLPALSPELDKETMAAARGYLDHEAAHIRHTDFDALKNAGLNKLEAWLFNAIEDWRVEKKLSEAFPGCARNFEMLIKRVFTGKTEAGHKNPAFVILDYVLLTARSWSVSDIDACRIEIGKFVDKKFGDLRTKIDAYLQQVPGNCESSSDAIHHAKKLEELIRGYFAKNENMNACSEELQKTRSQNDPSPVENAKGAMENPALSVSNDAIMPEAEIDQEELPLNMGDYLSRALDEVAGEDDQPGVAVAVVGEKTVQALTGEEKIEAMRSSVAIRQRLAGLLQARNLIPFGSGIKGKLDTRNLYRIYAGNAKVFRKNAEKTALNTAIHILLDCSSSMCGENMALANQACYALVKTLENIRGVNLALTAFPAEKEEDSVYPVIRHNQTTKHLTAVSAYGVTPLGPALWWVMQEMMRLKETRKIVFLVTDGVPTSVPAARTAIWQCQKMGIEILGIGIKSPVLSFLLPDSSISISDITELAPVMFELMRKTLLQGGIK